MTQDVLTELGTHLDNPIVFILVLLAVVYLFVSKRLAEISGPVGALARWWNGRQIAKVQRQRELWKAQHEADREHEIAERETERERAAAERTRWTERLENLEAELEWQGRELTDMRRRERLRDQQARKHTAWDNDVVQKLQAANIPVDGPPPPLYLELAPLHIPEENHP